MGGKAGERKRESENQMRCWRKRGRNGTRAWNWGGWIKQHRGMGGGLELQG